MSVNLATSKLCASAAPFVPPKKPFTKEEYEAQLRAIGAELDAEFEKVRDAMALLNLSKFNAAQKKIRSLFNKANKLNNKAKKLSDSAFLTSEGRKDGPPKFRVGDRVMYVNWMNGDILKRGVIVALRDDAYERKMMGDYYYHVQYDDKTFDTYTNENDLRAEK